MKGDTMITPPLMMLIVSIVEVAADEMIAIAVTMIDMAIEMEAMMIKVMMIEIKAMMIGQKIITMKRPTMKTSNTNKLEIMMTALK